MDYSKYVSSTLTVWLIAVPVFAFVEFRHPGFVSYVMPFYVLFVPIVVCVAVLIVKKK